MKRSTRRREREQTSQQSNHLPPGLEGGQYRPLSDADVQRAGALSPLAALERIPAEA